MVHAPVLLVSDPRFGFDRHSILDQRLKVGGGCPAARGVAPRRPDADDLDANAPAVQPSVDGVAVDRPHVSFELSGGRRRARHAGRRGGSRGHSAHGDEEEDG